MNDAGRALSSHPGGQKIAGRDITGISALPDLGRRLILTSRHSLI
jgi:hypothetical protein